MSELEKIRALVEKSSISMGKALRCYWPVINPEFNGLQEANVTFHFAAHAMQDGLHVFPEASNANTMHGHSRIDLLVRGVLDSDEIAVLVEAKKLFSAEKAAEMNKDYNKILGFEFVKPVLQRAPFRDVKRTYGVLLAITQNTANMEWWCSPYPWSQRSWSDLSVNLANACDKGSFKIDCANDQYILFAIYHL